MGRSPWPPGRSEPVLVGLVSRLAVRPEIAILINYRADKRIGRGETGEFACTYSGSDPTEDMLMHLVDALIAYERLRVEVMAPLIDSPDRAPAKFSSLAARLLPLDSLIVQAVDVAIEVNDMAWSDRFDRPVEDG